MIAPYEAIALGAGFLYAFASLFLKRVFQSGVGLTRVMFIMNVAMGVIFAPLWFYNKGPIPWDLFYQPFLVMIAGFAGQAFLYSGIRLGDVSVMTPIMGTKVIFVAFLSAVFLTEPIPIIWWIGSAMAVLAVFLMGIRDSSRPAKNAGLSITFALCGSLAFAISDIMVQRWSASFGTTAFMCIWMTTLALASFLLVPFFRGGIGMITKEIWPWLIAGLAMMIIQLISMFLAISFYGKATAINILYSGRGVFGVLLVWMVGKWFGNTERNLGRRIFIYRLSGAVLLFAAIVLVVVCT